MSLFLLDTDTVSLFQHGHPHVCQAVADHANDTLTIAVVTVEEQLSGWYSELRRLKKPADLAAIYRRMAETVRFYSRLPILNFDEPAIDRYESLKQMKLGVGKADLRIAAIALEKNAVVVPRNRRDLKRVPALLIEDWSR